MNPQVKGFFDPATCTVSYVLYEQKGSPCAIIDPVLDYDHKSGRTSTKSADRLISFIREQELQVGWIVETHAHADHLTSATYLRSVLGGRIAIGAGITRVQAVFKSLFHLEDSFQANGRQFDHLLVDGECITLGKLTMHALSVPGHTPACMAYQVGDAIFTGDTLFMPDLGTARCDFPGGDASALYTSIQRILAFPANTRLFLCHDYLHKERAACWETSVKEQKTSNIHVREGISQEQFVTMRTERDKTLDMPTLILPAIQINIRAGAFPPKEANGIAYAKIPLNAF